MKSCKQFQLIAIGGSAGSAEVISAILDRLPAGFCLPIVIVKHVSPDYSDSSYYISALSKTCRLIVKEADHREMITPGTVYLAPANYHLLIEKDRSFSLTVDEKVRFCRPAIDVLFETAADAYGNQLIGVILSGANDDGAGGLARIKEKGGYTIVQEPGTADFEAMPRAAMSVCQIDAILPPEEIEEFLMALANQKTG